MRAVADAVERLLIDGLPVFFAETIGPTTGAVVFRAGIADEPAPLRGIGHVHEHLTMFAVGSRNHMSNASIDLLETDFYARGTPQEVASFLDAVAAQLPAPPSGRLEDERRVLRSEAAGSLDSSLAWRLFLRFGNASFGAAWLHELGVGWVGEPELERWGRERFVSGNACVWWHGPEPPSRVPLLPPGERTSAPPAESLPRLSLPAYVARGTGAVAVTVVGERTAALTLALSVAVERLHEELRVQRALSYAVGGDWQTLSGTLAHASVAADCADEHAPQVMGVLLDVLDRLAAEGPGAGELETVRERLERSERDDPAHGRVMLERAASDELLGRPAVSWDERRAQRAAVTPEDAAHALRAALDTALVIAPAGTPPPRRELARYVPSSDEPVEGRTARARGLRTGGPRVTVGETGISHADGAGERTTILRGDVVAVLRQAGGALTILGRDGTAITIDPRVWRDGADLVAWAERAFPPALFVPEDRASRDLSTLATAQLDSIKWVERELELLPGQLLAGEEVRKLARATRGLRRGLLVLTDRRLLFLYSDGRGDEQLSLPLATVRAARGKRGVREGKLTVGHVAGERPEDVVFNEVRPNDRAEELAGTLTELAERR